MKESKIKNFFIFFVIAFYIAIVLYAAYLVIHIDLLANYVTAMVYEAISFVLLVFYAFNLGISKKINIGYGVPLILCTLVYLIVLDCIVFIGAGTISQVMFSLINLIVLFVYCVISIPMYIMGRR